MSESGDAPSNVSIALVHHPVYDRNRQVIATAITNLDLHDIARSARTYGLFRYFVVTPISDQRDLAARIVRHWQQGWGATYNPKRKAALELVKIVAALDEALSDLQQAYGRPAIIVTTGARHQPGSVTFRRMTELMADRSQPFLLIFGTGWGLTEEVSDRADLVLEPVKGVGGYNHLSVRSAAAIIMDRLFGVHETVDIDAKRG